MSFLLLAAAVPLGVLDAAVRHADRALGRHGDDQVVYDLAGWGTP